MKGLYIHIPFCKRICTYCDFPKQIAKEETKEIYLDYLLNEIASYESSGILKDIRSVYIGGGTPNSLSIQQLERLFQAIDPILKKSLENTIEINSELFTEDQAKLFVKYNINRVSIGAQTFDSKILKDIQRLHTYKIVKETVKLLRRYGIQNINIDMMYGLPNQSLKQLKQDVRKVLGLMVPHISYYSLILEEKTILEYQLKHHQITLPDDDLVVDMADYLTQKLKKKQFVHYEISNYAKKGYESTHNIGYWECEEYVGIGASAAGYIGSRRYKNAIRLKDYYNHIQIEDSLLSTEDSKKEYMLLGLRMLRGISIDKYFERFKTYPNMDFDLDKLYKMGLIEEKNNFIRIKKDKIWVANAIFEEFVG